MQHVTDTTLYMWPFTKIFSNHWVRRDTKIIIQNKSQKQGEVCLQITHLTKDLYPECMRKSQISVVRKQTAQ